MKSPIALQAALKNKEVVPFIGAGISMGAILNDGSKMPGYKELLLSMINLATKDCCWENRRLERKQCLSLIEDGQLNRAADILDRCIPPHYRLMYLRRILDPLHPRPSLVHELLNIYQFPVILTSNYDKILESTFYPRPEVIINTEMEIVPYVIREGRPIVFKIHGDLSRPGSIVLGWSSYRQLTHGDEFRALRKFICHTILTKSILFLGCSFQGTDFAEYFQDALSKIGTRRPCWRHYALVETGVPASRKNYWRKLGVELLEYAPDAEYSQVWEFVASLRPRSLSRPKQRKIWQYVYLPHERPQFLRAQMQQERKSSSCRYISYTLASVIATENYLGRISEIQAEKVWGTGKALKSFTRKLAAVMRERLQCMATLLADGVEVRAIFAAEAIDEEIQKLGAIALERYRHALELAKKYNLHMRAYRFSASDRAMIQSPGSLIFSQGSEPEVVAFYASPTGANLSHVCIAQANTPYATRRIEQFESYWSASLSEKETLSLLRSRIGGV